MNSDQLSADEQAWFDQLLRLARDFADAHNSLSMIKFAQARSDLQAHVMPNIKAARRCARYGSRANAAPVQEATESSTNPFVAWFIAQHGDRPGNGEPIDEFLVDAITRGKQAEQLLRDRVAWDDRRQSALSAWTFMSDDHTLDGSVFADPYVPASTSANDQAEHGFPQQIDAAKESFAERDPLDQAAAVDAVAMLSSERKTTDTNARRPLKRLQVSTKPQAKRSKKQKTSETT